VGAFVAELAAAQGVAVESVEREFFASARPTSVIQRFASTDEVAAMIRVDGEVVRAIV
jgi:hypothetical protein